MEITSRKGRVGNEQTVNSFEQLTTIQEDYRSSIGILDSPTSKSKKDTKNSEGKSKKKDDNLVFIDSKLRDLKRVWREKER